MCSNDEADHLCIKVEICWLLIGLINGNMQMLSWWGRQKKYPPRWKPAGAYIYQSSKINQKWWRRHIQCQNSKKYIQYFDEVEMQVTSLQLCKKKTTCVRPYRSAYPLHHPIQKPRWNFKGLLSCRIITMATVNVGCSLARASKWSPMGLGGGRRGSLCNPAGFWRICRFFFFFLSGVSRWEVQKCANALRLCEQLPGHIPNAGALPFPSACTRNHCNTSHPCYVSHPVREWVFHFWLFFFSFQSKKVRSGLVSGPKKKKGRVVRLHDVFIHSVRLHLIINFELFIC